MSILKNYRDSIILLSAVCIGAIIGVQSPETALFVKPLGDIFINMMFVIIVPLVFFSILSAITSAQSMERMKNITLTAFAVFVSLLFLASLAAYFGFIFFNPLDGASLADMTKNIKLEEPTMKPMSELIVGIFSASDFNKLFSRTQLLPLIVFGFLIGISILSVGEKAKPVAVLAKAINEVLLKFINILMVFAPIGLGSYFAYTISELGSQILSSYLKAFLLYIGLTIFYWAVMCPFYAFVAQGKKGVKLYFLNIIPPTIMALATSSSAACITINLETARKMNIQDDVAETVIPLGATIHKNGSAFSFVIKICFLFALTGQSLVGENTLIILGVAMLGTTLVGAIPGGGMAGEIMICSMFGFNNTMLSIILLYATIIDVPATVVNSNGNLMASMLVEKFVGKKTKKESSSEVV